MRVSGSDPALPPGYPELLDELKAAVATARLRAHRTVNTELLALYWQIGHKILERQQAEGWGTRVVDRLAVDLRAAFPQMRGLSRSNLKYMRQMAGAWPRNAIGQQPVGQLPWGHVTVLLDKLNAQAERDWYAASAAEVRLVAQRAAQPDHEPAAPARRRRPVELHRPTPTGRQ